MAFMNYTTHHFFFSGSNTYNVTASGGMVLDCSTIVRKITNATASGDMILGGSATVQEEPNITASGGTILGGSVTTQKTPNVIASGGMVLGDTSMVQEEIRITVSGGCNINGNSAIDIQSIRKVVIVVSESESTLNRFPPKPQITEKPDPVPGQTTVNLIQSDAVVTIKTKPQIATKPEPTGGRILAIAS